MGSRGTSRAGWTARQWRQAIALLGAVAVVATAAVVAGSLRPGPIPGTPPARHARTSRSQSEDAGSAVTVRVSGRQLVNGAGRPVRLLGVDRSGSEYACVQGWGIFDGPSDASSVAAIAAWHIDAVRVPLNEDCWLGINGVDPSFSGSAYRAAIESYVGVLNSYGIVAVLDLHWSAPGPQLATGQQDMADSSHSPAFWASVASTFESDSGVIFDLYNEPHTISWTCWLHGCATSQGWQAAGMQTLLDAVRSTGADQPVMANGDDWGGTLAGWLTHEPVDPDHQLIAGAHIYNFSGCNSAACWQSTIAPVAASVPVVTGELGENDCAQTFIDAYMGWADSVGVSYLGWTWDAGGGWTCGAGPSLITGYTGSPTPFGAGLKGHLALVPASTLTLGSGAPPTFSTYTRIDGPTAAATAAQELEHEFPDGTGRCPGTTGSRSVVLATDRDYPDALAGSYLARALGTGTLLTPPTALSGAARSAIRDEGITSVDVVGGPLAVSTAVVNALASTPVSSCGGGAGATAADIQVTRVSGATEYSTATAIALAASGLAGVGSADVAGAYGATGASGGAGRYNDTSGSASGGPAEPGALPTAILATGSGFQDAEAASTLSYAERFPILLTTPTTLAAGAGSAISELGVKQVLLMGGPLAVSNGVVTALESLGVSVLRIAGADYTDTSVQLARFETTAGPTGLGWAGTGDLTVARGDFFTDGLAGSVVAAGGPTSSSPEPLVLTVDPESVGAALTDFLEEAGSTGIGGSKVTRLTILGGPLALTGATVDAMGSDL